MGCWECPLCCRKSFPNKLTLKYHLLSSILISCPNCYKNFNGILELANHLDGDCHDERMLPTPVGRNNGKVSEPVAVGKESAVKKESAVGNESAVEIAALPVVSTASPVVSTASPVVSTASPVVSTGDTSSKATVPESPEPPNDDDSSDVPMESAGLETLEQWQENENGDDGGYFCMSCNCHIERVMEHIEKFHADEPQVYIQEDAVGCVTEEAYDTGDEDEYILPVDDSEDQEETEFPVNQDVALNGGTADRYQCQESSTRFPIQLKVEFDENVLCLHTGNKHVSSISNDLSEELSKSATEPLQDSGNDAGNSKTDGLKQQAIPVAKGLEKNVSPSKPDKSECIKKSAQVCKSFEPQDKNVTLKVHINSSVPSNNSVSKTLCTNPVTKIGSDTRNKQNVTVNDDETDEGNDVNPPQSDSRIDADQLQTDNPIPARSSAVTSSPNLSSTQDISLSGSKQKGRKKSELCIVERADLVDKSGIPYVRNVVKIGKFWDSKSLASGQKVVSEESEMLQGGSSKIQDPATEDSEHQYALNLPETMDTDSDEFSDSNMSLPTKRPKRTPGRKPGISNKCIKYPVSIPDAVECPEGNLMCSACCRKFPDQDEYQSHKCKRKGRTYLAPSTCTICQTVCISPCDLDLHQHLHRNDVVKALRTRKKERICEVCYMHSYSPVRFKTHFNLHILEKKSDKPPALSALLGILKCSECNAVFRDNEGMIEHWKTHKASGQIQVKNQKTPADVLEEGNCSEFFLCGICGKRVPEGGRKAHEELHRGKGVLACPICNKPFYNNSQADLSFHMIVHNNMDNKFPCFYCKQKFDNVYLLRKHVTETHPMLNRPYPCSFCGRRFFKVTEKKKHEKIHTGEKRYPCEVCGARFRSAYCRRIHMRIHTGMRPHCCPVCGKTFRTLPAVNHHVRIHSDARPYTCPHCPKAFKSRVNLGNHVRQHEKRFTCQVCGRRFADLFTMRSHLKAHTLGTLIAQCVVCGASYGREYAMQEHIKADHPHIKIVVSSPKTPEKIAKVVKAEKKPRKPRQKKSLSEVERAVDPLLVNE